MNIPWKVTYFTKEPNGDWGWQGFRDEIQSDSQVEKLFKTLSERAERDEGFAAFVIDLNNPGDEEDEELPGGFDSNEEAELSASVELQLLQAWLDEVVQIDKITVEEEYNEYRKRKLAEAETEEE